jgi:hypothetical protein
MNKIYFFDIEHNLSTVILSRVRYVTSSLENSMSRYTRWLRKQAKAQTADQAHGQENSGGTAVLDRPRPARPNSVRTSRSSLFEPVVPREEPQPVKPAASGDNPLPEFPACATA